MVKSLEAQTEANRANCLPLYRTDALAQEYEEQGKGLGVRNPELKKLRKATLQEEMAHYRQNCVDPLVGTEAYSWNERHHMAYGATRCIFTARIGTQVIAPARYLGCC
jgi:hypothetical protein